MAERRSGGRDRDEHPAEGTPEYRWLYGEDAPPGDEATRFIPTDSTRPRRTHNATPPPAGPPVDTPPRGPRRPGRPRAGTGKRIRRALTLVLMLWLVFLVAVPLFAWSRFTTVDAAPDERPAEQPGTTYLVVGSDSRGGLTPEEQEEFGTGPDDVGQRTDTIMLLHTGSGPNLLMSIPRDSRVQVPGRGTNKINAAFAWGGAPLLVETVEQNTGIRVDHYVEIGFGGLVKMVDAVGGIEICPTQPMKDPEANLDIEKGCQEADGKTALGYARSRKTYKALGDVDRARAQREVVSAIGSEALSPWTVINPVRYWRLSMATAQSFTVSEGSSPFSLARFGLAMTRVDGENGLTCGVPISDLAVTWHPERSKQLFDLVAADRTADVPEGLCTPSGFPE